MSQITIKFIYFSAGWSQVKVRAVDGQFKISLLLNDVSWMQFLSIIYFKQIKILHKIKKSVRGDLSVKLFFEHSKICKNMDFRNNLKI